MSAARPSRDLPPRTAVAPARDSAQLRERRRHARRHQRLARLDLGLGVLGAIVLLLATPGLAVSALIALLVLALCGLSLVLERRRRARIQASRSRVRAARSPNGQRGQAPDRRRRAR